MPRLKICGLRHPAQAAAVARLGVDAIGVIGVPNSPRYLPAERRKALFEAVAAASPTCLRVLVVADPGDEEVDSLRSGHGHDVLQLHGRETARRCDELRRSLDVRIWKALRVRQPADLLEADAYRDSADALLLDAWVDGQLGGTGARIPVEWLKEFHPPLPWWLAGGITPERLGPLQSEVRPDGFDVSSGVERAPGDKDLGRVADLVRILRDQ
jgi:phosphoribosylanthranilate isomerase